MLIDDDNDEVIIVIVSLVYLDEVVDEVLVVVADDYDVLDNDTIDENIVIDELEVEVELELIEVMLQQLHLEIDEIDVA